MSPMPNRLMLATARADLLDGHGDLARHGVPDHVAASWRRSLSGGVSPDSVESTYFTQLDIESRLVQCAQPVIDQLAEQIADVPMCVALTDSQARILARKDSSAWIGRILDRVYFAQGFGYAEGVVGTNGVGTVLEFGRSVQIVGAEHFVDTLQTFACAGAPVRDPFTGRIEGVLDISCLSDDSSPLMHSLVRSAARQIEHNLVLDRDQAQQALLDMYSRVQARSRDALLAIGPKVVIANTMMQTLVSPGDQEALHDHIRFLAASDVSADERVALPSGVSVRVKGSRVTVGDEIAGMICVVALLSEVHVPAAVREPLSRPASSSPTSSSPASSSPAWNAAAGAIGAALRAGRPVIVLGEPGSGRLTVLKDQFRRQGLGCEVTEFGSKDIEADPDGVAAAIARATPGRLHVLGDIDQLSAATVYRLMAEMSSQSWESELSRLAATAAVQPGPGCPGSAVHPLLLAAFRDSATLPPLRHRSADVPGLTAVLLHELAPHRDVWLSDGAARVVARYRWPGNISELKQALGRALARRPVGEIRPQDLPAYCQAAPGGVLRPVDEAERDAIVAALIDTGGNRKAAARALGLARSTLYRKIHQYGLTG